MSRFHRPRVGWIWAAATLSLLCVAPPAAAQGFLLPRHPGPPAPGPGPRLLPISIRNQKVDVSVEAGVMRVEVAQDFHNPNPMTLEGTYVFPIPDGAQVSNFRLTINNEPTDGKILTREEARRIYEDYVRRSVDPAILEFVGRTALRARVFPIPGNGDRHISLVYHQAMPFEEGVYRGILPMNQERAVSQPAAGVTIHGVIRSPQAIRTVYSPSHDLDVKMEGERKAQFTFESSSERLNRDFVFYYTVSERAFGLNAIPYRRAGEPGYVLLSLAPPREVPESQLQPKDVVFVIDTSGSMQGEKIEQARNAMQTMLGALAPTDRFNIVRFSSDVTPFRDSVVTADAANVREARAFAAGFRAVGGTAIGDSLRAGLESIPTQEKRRGRAAFLIFLTDGLPTIGVVQPQQILADTAKVAPADVRIFSFGVGHDVNTTLLDRLAADHHGVSDYVAPSEDIEVRVGSFYKKIARPVLSNVRLQVDGRPLTQIEPANIPDLFAGSQLLIAARYAEAGTTRIRLTGELAGKSQSHEYQLTLPERSTQHDFVPRIWAGRRIGRLLEAIRRNGESSELKNEVIALSKEHGIVTPYTSYLVEEPGGPVPSLQTRGVGGTNRTFPLSTGGVPGGSGGGFGGGGFGGVGGGATSEAARQQVFRRDRQNAGASASKSASGKDAVAYSQRIRDLKEQTQGSAEVETSRQAGGRSFRRASGRWVQEKLPAKPARTVEIKFGSPAYFQLVSASPEWARYLAVEREVTFQSGAQSVVAIYASRGKDTLTAAELAQLRE